jgi:Flp pilus assembly protein TadB
MSTESTTPSTAEIVDEVSKWTVGLGIVTFALFPLALPILILTVVAALPLLVPVLAVGVLVAVVVLPIRLVRSLRRRAARARPTAQLPTQRNASA